MSKKRKIFGEIPQEISVNLQAPELAPSDKRITGRTKQLNFKVKEEFYWQLKNRAVEEKCMLVEVLERAFVEYQRQREEEHQYQSSSKEKTVQKSTQQLNQFWKVNFICDKCQKKFKKSVVYSPAPDLDYLNEYPTYCVDCVEENK
jgi:hypothetical protein